MATQRKRRVIVAFSGASGPEYPLRILELLAGMGVESHFVMSRSAKVSLAHESDLKVRDFEERATRVYDNADLAAPISSGSFLTEGMIVAPCSAKSLGEIAAGIGGTLIARAADVMLKERRRLVLMVAGVRAVCVRVPPGSRPLGCDSVAKRPHRRLDPFARRRRLVQDQPQLLAHQRHVHLAHAGSRSTAVLTLPAQDPQSMPVTVHSISVLVVISSFRPLPAALVSIDSGTECL